MKRAGGEESVAEAAATRWRKLKNLLQPPAQLTHTQTFTFANTQRRIETRVPLFKNSKKLRASVA